MASHVDPKGTLPVIELGPGTGVVTKALIERGVHPSRIIAIEYSPDFCRLLAERFPGITVIRGDAYDLDTSLDGRAPKVANVDLQPAARRPSDRGPHPPDRSRRSRARRAAGPSSSSPTLSMAPVYPVPPALHRRALALDLDEHAAGPRLALPAGCRLMQEPRSRIRVQAPTTRCAIMASPKILVFAGSTRTGALSGKLAALAAKELALADADVTRISLADYPLPIYNGDLEKEKGIPENAVKLARLIATQQGVFIATPEYNNSLPPLLKNTIDWVSRNKPGPNGIPYRNKVYGIGSTSDGLIGGARALIDLRRVVLTAVGAILVPEKIEISRAQEAFDESGELIAEPPAKLLKSLCRHLVELSRRLSD